MADETPSIPFDVLGSIRVERCPLHVHVEWDVGSEARDGRTYNVASPAFDVGTHLLFLNLRLQPRSHPVLGLFGQGNSLPRAVRFWMGFRFHDGKILFTDFTDKLNPREKVGLWSRVSYFETLSFDYMKKMQEGSLTIFFRMNVEKIGEGTCTHHAPRLPLEISGSVREERCPSHTQFKWDLDYETLESEIFNLDSPVFEIGSQLFFFKLGKVDDNFLDLTLMRSGASVPGSFRYWVGTGGGDGNRTMWVSAGELDLREDLGLWTAVANLMYFSNPDCETQNLTFFFRLNVDPTGEGTCTHDPDEEDALEGEGSIRKEDCLSHRYIEWDVAYSSSRDSEQFSASPVFEVRNQRYQMRLSCVSDALVGLRLYRVGPTAQESVRCWVGIKNCDWTHHHRTQVKDLDLRQEHSLWAEMAFFRLPSRTELERSHVTSDGRLALFMRVDWKRSTPGEGACAHGAAKICPRGEGKIENTHRVEWEVPYEVLRDYTHYSTSPVFKVRNQDYLLELLYEADGHLTLSLYRSGPAIEGSDPPVRYSSGLQDGWEITYCKKGAELDLREDSALWTRAAVLGHYRRSDMNETETGFNLKYFFRVWSNDDDNDDICVIS